MACNATLFLSRLIQKCFRGKFLHIFRNVWSLHICFCTDSFWPLGWIIHANVRDVFFAPPGTTYTIKETFINPWWLFLLLTDAQAIDVRSISSHAIVGMRNGHHAQLSTHSCRTSNCLGEAVPWHSLNLHFFSSQKTTAAMCTKF